MKPQPTAQEPIFLSVIVPILADVDAAATLLGQLTPHPATEIVVADGGGNDAIAPIAGARQDVRIVRCGRGRGTQLNAGAAVARGDWLLFLHADSTLPPAWRDTLVGALRQRPQAVGGWFRFALDDASWQARAIERGVAWRVRHLRLPYGDQGLFVRRDTFTAIGGFRDWPLMEDVDFVRRLVAAGDVVELDARLVTSARRWRRDGWLQRSARNVTLLALYFCGVAPDRLARWYERGA